jgi:hypothetical protein
MKTKIFPILTYQSTAIIAQSEESNLAPYLATSPLRRERLLKLEREEKNRRGWKKLATS